MRACAYIRVRRCACDGGRGVNTVRPFGVHVTCLHITCLVRHVARTLAAVMGRISDVDPDLTAGFGSGIVGEHEPRPLAWDPLGSGILTLYRLMGFEGIPHVQLRRHQSATGSHWVALLLVMRSGPDGVIVKGSAWITGPCL